MDYLFRFVLSSIAITATLGAIDECDYHFYEESEASEQNENPERYYYPCVRQKGRRWGDDPYWRHDRFAEEQFQETGWPGRRGDELSDILSR